MEYKSTVTPDSLYTNVWRYCTKVPLPFPRTRTPNKTFSRTLGTSVGWPVTRRDRSRDEPPSPKRISVSPWNYGCDRVLLSGRFTTGLYQVSVMVKRYWGSRRRLSPGNSSRPSVIHQTPYFSFSMGMTHITPYVPWRLPLTLHITGMWWDDGLWGILFWTDFR